MLPSKHDHTKHSLDHVLTVIACTALVTPEAQAVVELVAGAASPEEAAKTGRRFQRQQPKLVRPDWDAVKLEVMLAALRAKVCCHICTSLSISLAGKRLAACALNCDSMLSRCCSQIIGV